LVMEGSRNDATRHPRAREFVNSLPVGELRTTMHTAIDCMYQVENIGGAVMNRIEDGQFPADQRNLCFRLLTRENPHAAYLYVRQRMLDVEHGERPAGFIPTDYVMSVMNQWIHYEGDMAARRLLAIEPGTDRNSRLQAAVAAWASREPVKVGEWLRAVEDSLGDRDHAIASYVRVLVDRRDDQAEIWMKSISDASLRDQVKNYSQRQRGKIPRF
jgi:hypothetical protein